MVVNIKLMKLLANQIGYASVRNAEPTPFNRESVLPQPTNPSKLLYGDTDTVMTASEVDVDQLVPDKAEIIEERINIYKLYRKKSYARWNLGE